EVGIPRSVQIYLRMWLFSARRGVSHTPSNVLNTPTSHASKCGRKHSAPTVLLLCFLCLFNHARPQSRALSEVEGSGAAPGQTIRQIKDTTDTTLAIDEVQVIGYGQT